MQSNYVSLKWFVAVDQFIVAKCDNNLQYA